MNVHKIKYKDTYSFSKLVENYTEKSVDPSMYNRYPCLSDFSDQIKEKSKQKSYVFGPNNEEIRTKSRKEI